MNNPIEKWFDSRRPTAQREFTQIQDSFDRMFNDLLNVKKMSSLQDFNFTPSCEISEDDNKYFLKFDLPGVPKDQVKVEVINDRLLVSAERKEEKKTENKKRHMSEIYYGSYSRAFDLPGPVDEKQVDAKFENGVLSITLPKTASTKAKQIAVQ